MNLVICPKCGTKNRVPVTPGRGKVYRCGKCKARLIVASESKDSHQLISHAKLADRADHMQVARIGSIASKPSFLNSLLSWFKESDYRIIFSIALLALILHLAIIPGINRPIYDEKIYVQEAKSIIQGGQIQLDQFSLGKLLITSGIRIWGDNPWGWRFASLIFACALIILFYFVCRKLAGKATAFFSVLVLTFESFIFDYSSLAMIEVFIFAFMLLSFLFYLKDRYILSGISLAFSGLVKLTGLLGIAVILGHWLIIRRAKSPINMGLLIVSAAALFMLLMPIFDYAATREWLNPLNRLSFVLQYHESKTWTSLHGNFLALESPPWQWILSPAGFREWGTVWLSRISPPVWIMIIPSMVYMVYEFVRKRTGFSLFILLWFAVPYCFWMFITLAIHRVTYQYYFYPSLLAVCAAIGFVLSEFWQQAANSEHSRLIRVAIIGYLGLNLWFMPHILP